MTSPDDGAAALLALVQRVLSVSVAAAVAPLEAKIDRLEAKIATGPDADHMLDAAEVGPLVGVKDKDGKGNDKDPATVAKALRARIARGKDPIAVELGKLARTINGRQRWRRGDVLALLRGPGGGR